jgi:serine/threonine protein kinase
LRVIYKNLIKIRSVAYLAPEILRRSGHNKTVDWYLLGVLIYEMVTGLPPYYNQSRERLF